MRHGYLILCAAGCGFHSPSGTGSSPPPLVPDGAVAETRSLDAAALLKGQLVDMTVDAANQALTPAAYTYGGLIAHGLQGTRLWFHNDSAWSKLVGKAATGAGLWCGERITNPMAGMVRLDYLGVVNDTTMTIWLEGEVWLDGQAGEMFHVNGDDIGFVEIARPGSTSYVRLAENATAAVPESGAGWYPIRVGFANGDVPFDFTFRHIDPGGGGEIAWTRDRMRARTSELTGVLRTVYGRQILAGGQALAGNVVAAPVLHFEQDKLLTVNSFNTAPQGADTDNNDWSARYVGQLHVTTPGSYSLRIESHDGSRGRLGSGRAEFGWIRGMDTDSGDPPTVATATLDAGWNDLAVDYNQSAGTRLLRVQIQGPDFPALVEVPRDQLRPVEPADDRLALGVDDTPSSVPDNGGAGNAGTSTLSVVGYHDAAVGAETVDSIELTYEGSSQHWEQIKLELEAPGGARVAIRDKDNTGGAGSKTVQFAVPANAAAPLSSLLGGPAHGDWKLHMFDDVAGGSSVVASLTRARLTLHTRGGPDTVARAASWTSAVIDATTRVVAIDGVSWTERVPAGAAIQVRLATCQQADCSDAMWSGPVSNGMPLAISAARYLQLRVEMTGNGTREPELGGLSVGFRRDPG